MSRSLLSTVLVAASLAAQSGASPASRSQPRQAGGCNIGGAASTDPRSAFFKGVLGSSSYLEDAGEPCAPGTPLKVGIIGAGAAGLYAAILLDSLNIDYDIYESSERVGGRMYTYRFSESDDPTDPAYYDYYDVGAMRFPPMEYMDRVIGSQSCALIPYINSKLEPGTTPVTQIPYYFKADNTFRRFNGVLALNQDGVSADVFDVSLNNVTFDAADAGSVWRGLLDNMTEALTNDFTTGFNALMDLDSHSVRGWLLDQGFTNGQINWMETVNDATGHYDFYSMSQAVLEEWVFTSSDITKWTAINGGMGKVTDGMYEIIKTKPQFKSRVTQISKNDDGTLSLGINGGAPAASYAHVISTAPLGALQAIDLEDLDLDYFQRSAIRELQYDPSMKIGMKFKTRWWETLPSGPFKGGQSFTDRPIRRAVYPSYGVDLPDAPGTMIASYTWGQDASRLGAYLNPHDTASQAPPAPESFQSLVDIALADLAVLNNVTLEFVTEQYVSAHAYDWYQSEHSVGAFAIFGPGQFSSMMPYLMKPGAKGHLHFGGEALSSGHAWIIGAVNSAYRTVVEVLANEGMHDEIQSLVDMWGLIDEVDMGWYKWTPQDAA